MLQLSFWIKLVIYNSSIWIEFAFRHWKKSILFIHQLFRASNVIVHKFVGHPVCSMWTLLVTAGLPVKERTVKHKASWIWNSIRKTPYYRSYLFGWCGPEQSRSIQKNRELGTSLSLPNFRRLIPPNLIWSHFQLYL